MTSFKRDSSWVMIRPGLYVDPAGYGHIFPDEVCAELGWPYTRENYELIVQMLREMLPPEHRVEIAQHERQAS